MTVVTGMNTDDHTTRTLLISQKVDGMLLISRGSTANIDPAAEMLSSGHSQIKAFNLNNITADGYSYDTDGLRLGYVHFGPTHPSYFLQILGLNANLLGAERSSHFSNPGYDSACCPEKAMLTPKFA